MTNNLDRILVLSKHKSDTNTQFIDAGNLFQKATNNNILTDDDEKNNPGHIQQIMQAFDSKENVDHFAKSISLEKIAANDYNLSVSSYVEAKDNREAIDRLRSDIDDIVAEIEAGK